MDGDNYEQHNFLVLVLFFICFEPIYMYLSKGYSIAFKGPEWFRNGRAEYCCSKHWEKTPTNKFVIFRC